MTETNPLHDQIVEIGEEIAILKAKIKRARHQQRLHFLLIISILAGTAILLYIGLRFVDFNDLTNSDPNKSLIPTAFIFLGGTGGLFGLAYIIAAAGIIVSKQTSIASFDADIGVWEARRRSTSQFAALSEKPSYFESLVRINVENLAAYYALVKVHTDNSYKVAIRICVCGFVLIIAGLIIGFVDFANAHTVSYIASGSGVITEFISSIFFYLYNRTVRQMKEYHDSLLTVQNILLSFKLVDDTHDEGEKAKIVSQMLAYLINKQSSPSLVGASSNGTETMVKSFSPKSSEG